MSELKLFENESCVIIAETPEEALLLYCKEIELPTTRVVGNNQVAMTMQELKSLLEEEGYLEDAKIVELSKEQLSVYYEVETEGEGTIEAVVEGNSYFLAPLSSYLLEENKGVL